MTTPTLYRYFQPSPSKQQGSQQKNTAPVPPSSPVSSVSRFHSTPPVSPAAVCPSPLKTSEPPANVSAKRALFCGGRKRLRDEVGESDYDIVDRGMVPAEQESDVGITSNLESSHKQPEDAPMDDFGITDDIAELPEETFKELDKLAQSVSSAKVDIPPVKKQSFLVSPTLASNKEVRSPNPNSKDFTDGFFNTSKRKQLHKEVAEERYPFLSDIRDEQMRKPGEPDYDSKTLHIPAKCWATMTAYEKQYWQVKAKNFDKILFWKKGKFYELYENDAILGEKLFGLKLTARQNMTLGGVPDKTIKSWMNKFLRAGYDVVQADEKSAESSKKQKLGKGAAKEIMTREVTRIYTAGTIVEEEMLADSDSVYLLAFAENRESCTFGVCFIDVATGDINLGEFIDDKQRTQFETLLSQYRPGEVLYEKDGIMSPSSESMLHVRTLARNPRSWRGLKPGVEFVTKETTMDYFVQYYGEDQEKWPQAVAQLRTSNLAMAAAGTCAKHLKDLNLDEVVFVGRPIRLYNPLQDSAMLIDGQTLRNLEILQNNTDKTESGTLLRLVDHCISPFGHRMLRRWLCHPLRDIEQINYRYDAVEDLLGLSAHTESDLMQELAEALKPLPDLERMFSRARAKSLPVEQFLKMAKAIENWSEVLQNRLAPRFIKAKSTALRKLATPKTLQGYWPDMDALLQQMYAKFKIQEPSMDTYLLLYLLSLTTSSKGKKKAVVNDSDSDDDSAPAFLQSTQLTIRPKPGSNDQYDKAEQEAEETDSQLNSLLESAKKHFSCDKVALRTIRGDTVFFVPTQAAAKKKPPKDWIEKDHTKSGKRFICKNLQCLADKLKQHKDEMDAIAAGLLCELLGMIDAAGTTWSKAIGIIAQLDCLYSIAKASSLLEAPYCRPIIEAAVGQPFLILKNSRHPCVASALGDNFVPNDIVLGQTTISQESQEKVATPPAMLITGPNMGGKSTLLRQACVCVIMAQLGCFVPAEYCALTPVDRIFTRIGASDNIVRGLSTFMVELQETSSVLRHATKDSLVILDELGRGTSTYDGYAIAYAVLQHLLETLSCRVLFSTHYTTLTDEFLMESEAVSLNHMACQASGGEQDDVVFLYKLCPGVCPKSYGMMVAKMAGLPLAVVDHARDIAAEFEQGSTLARRRDAAAEINVNLTKKILSAKRNVPQLTLLKKEAYNLGRTHQSDAPNN